MATNIGGVSAAANETGAADLVLTAASNLWNRPNVCPARSPLFFAGVRAA